MISVGIDVAKDKHDCCIINSYGEVLEDSFVITNNKEGFDELYLKIEKYIEEKEKIKVGLEATGHYSKNILNFLFDKNLCIYLINPLQTDLYRKATSLRKTKTDKIDACNIALLLLSGIDLKPYTKKSYQISNLKQLTRSRFSTMHDRSKQKIKFVKLIDIVFPELEKIIKDVNSKTIYELINKYPSANKIASAHISTLVKLISKHSRNKISYEKIESIYMAAKNSIGTSTVATTLEIKHTIMLLKVYDEQIKDLDLKIKEILSEMNTQITSIPGIGITTGASIIAEIGDISLFSSPDKIQAFAGISPSTYQSGKLDNCYSHMEKRGSKFLRYSIFIAARCVVMWDKRFRDYMNKKLNEGKHYFVALSHVAKKLIRIIFALETKHQSYKIN